MTARKILLTGGTGGTDLQDLRGLELDGRDDGPRDAAWARDAGTDTIRRTS